MITKVYKMTEIDCANCAAKVEAKIQKIKGVKEANVAFFTKKLTITAEEADFAAIYPAAVAACKKVEPDCDLVEIG